MTRLRLIAGILAATAGAGCAQPAPEAAPSEPAPLAIEDVPAPTPSSPPMERPDDEPAPLPEAMSLLGERLFAPPLDAETRATYERNLAAARAAFDADPSSEEAIIWLGRRLAYLGRYGDAIAVYTDGLKIHPNSYKLLRHRGHRFITVRQLFAAVTDLRRAAELIDGVPDEVEPDGLPNARNLPRSTSHSNIYYHLGLAHYLRGNYERARGAYERCLEFAANDDMYCATAYWLFLTNRKLGRIDAADAVLEPIRPDMDIIENTSYHRLLLLYRGDRAPEQVLPAGADPVDDATIGYGIGCWYLFTGRGDQARAVFREVVAGPSWPAFGHIAAEAELARLEGSPVRR